MATPDVSNWELTVSETFESNYNIDLEKYCAETNQPLEGTTFNVWEDFDFSQINEGGYTEGEPDGTTGEVYLNCMTPEPESDYVCDTITTDTNGQASHSDARFYNYSKTYCMDIQLQSGLSVTMREGREKIVKIATVMKRMTAYCEQWDGRAGVMRFHM